VLLQDGMLYFSVSVVIGITDIVFLEAFKSPVLASMVIPLHVALTSVMTTRLVNNVFHVVTDGSQSARFLVESKSDGSGRTVAQRTPMGVVSSKSQTSNPMAMPKFTVGSGVGTDLFDEVGMKSQRDDLEDGAAIGPGKVLSGKHTYALPMQVRSPMTPGPRSASADTSIE
jgi:hypothetical protein